MLLASKSLPLSFPFLCTFDFESNPPDFPLSCFLLFPFPLRKDLSTPPLLADVGTGELGTGELAAGWELECSLLLVVTVALDSMVSSDWLCWLWLFTRVVLLSEEAVRLSPGMDEVSWISAT